MSLFKRKKAGEEANTIPEAMDDITQTLLIPVKDEGEKTMCADAYETSQAEIASYTSIGTRKSQQDSICFDFGDFCTVCAVCDGMGGLTGGERASALAAHGKNKLNQALMQIKADGIYQEISAKYFPFMNY